MNAKRRDALLLVVLVFLLFAINYSFLDKTLEEFLIDYEIVHVERVIDGDTIVADNNSTRLLGINSPEKGEIYYEEAKEFLENLILNETVRLKFGKDKYDRYDRVLAYIYFENKNVNLEIVKQGLANFYFPSGKDVYYSDFKKSWEKCINDNVNLCEASVDVCSECIKLNELNYNSQTVVLYNNCDIQCDLTGWNIKDEGRKKFTFPSFILESQKEVIIELGEGVDSNDKLFWTGEDYVWTRTGDSLFLRDDEGKLVLWESY